MNSKLNTNKFQKMSALPNITDLNKNQEKFHILLRELALLLWELNMTEQDQKKYPRPDEDQNFLFQKTLNQLKIKTQEKKQMTDMLTRLFEKIQNQIPKLNFEFKRLLMHSFYIETKGVLEKYRVVPIKITSHLKPESEIINDILRSLAYFIQFDPETKNIQWNLEPQAINQVVKDLINIRITVEKAEECDLLMKKFIKQRDWRLEAESIKNHSGEGKPKWSILTFQDKLSDEFFEIQIITPDLEKFYEMEKKAEKALKKQNQSSFFTQNINTLLLQLGLAVDGVYQWIV